MSTGTQVKRAARPQVLAGSSTSRGGVLRSADALKKARVATRNGLARRGGGIRAKAGG